MSKRSVLVIGGGAAGHQIAYQLRDDANVTLVDPKTYWEVPMAVPRLLVEPDALKARIAYKSFLGPAQNVQVKGRTRPCARPWRRVWERPCCRPRSSRRASKPASSIAPLWICRNGLSACCAIANAVRPWPPTRCCSRTLTFEGAQS